MRRPRVVIEVRDAQGNIVDNAWNPPAPVIVVPTPPPPPQQSWHFCAQCTITGGNFGRDLSSFIGKAFSKRHATCGTTIESRFVQ